MARPHVVRSRLHFVYEDEVLLVVNKPAGLLTVPLERRGPVPSVYDLIRDRFRSHRRWRPFVVHRIDEDTSGLVVFAKNADAQRALMSQFRRREPERTYLAVVTGKVAPRQGTWRDHLVWDTKALVQKRADASDPRGIEALCDYKVVEEFDRASLIEIRLRTGRRNQIRIQAWLHGHPLVGEARYAPKQGSIRFGRQALHAFRLSFFHPVDGTRMELEAPLPPDFLDLLARLRPSPRTRRSTHRRS